MRALRAVIALALVSGAPVDANEQAITLAISPEVISCNVGDHVTLLVTLKNTSKVARYLHSDLALTLDYAVKSSSGAVVLPFNDPPLFGRTPEFKTHRIWLDAGKSIQFTQRLPLVELGIREAGEFNLVGFWTGITKTEQQLESEDTDTSFSHSEPVRLLVSSPEPR